MKLYRIKNRQSFGFSAENPTGQKNGGTKGKDCEKLRPCIQIAPGETVTLCDTDGPGMITHIWFTGYVGHSFVMRIYWENEEFPSVEAPISAFFGCAYDENFKDRDGNYIVLNSAKILTAPGRGFNSYWEMPFEKHCRITMENRSKKEETLYYMISGWYLLALCKPCNVVLYRLSLYRIAFFCLLKVLFQHLCVCLLRQAFIVLPVIYQVVVCKQYVHSCSILCNLIGAKCTLLRRVHAAYKSTPRHTIRLVQACQKHYEKSHVIV